MLKQSFVSSEDISVRKLTLTLTDTNGLSNSPICGYLQ